MSYVLFADAAGRYPPCAYAGHVAAPDTHGNEA
jgi:hypothetical protein